MKTNKIIFYGGILILAIVLMAFAPITQPQGYHQFAEQRIIANLPHFGDVLSNLAFILVGFLLLFKSKEWKFDEIYKGQKNLFNLLAYSCIILGLGSGYYHLNPTDSTLVWDRITMVLGFSIIFYDSCIRYNIFGKDKVITGVVLTATIFVGTVIFWVIFDRLEPYFLIQASAIVLLILALRNYKEIPSKHLFYLCAWYAVAKICENQDKLVFMLSSDLISGHTIKHLASAVALYVFGKNMLKPLSN
jgi:hypothetical protein